MKYKINLFLLSILFSNLAYSLEDYTNQMFMFTKSIYNSIGMQQASWHDIGFHTQKTGSSVQIYTTYGQSISTTNSPEYFLFNHKNELTIRGASNPTGYTLTQDGYVPNNPTQDQISSKSFKRDILGQWFNLNETTNLQDHTFTVKPSQKQASGIIEFNQELKKVLDWSMVDLWYVSARIPITYVSNNLGLTGDDKAIEALTTNNNYHYANFTTTSSALTRPSYLELTLGTKYLNDRDAQIISGFGATIPMIEQTNSCQLFAPLNGQNAHFGLTALALFEFPVLRKYEHSKSRVCYFFEFQNNFLARNKQLRTYDLIDKPYSRYMKLLDRKTNSLVPAANVLTVRSRVEPFNIFNMASGFRFKYGHCVGEVGYELWAHGTEVVTPELEIPWDNDRYGIAFINEKGELAKIDAGGNIQPLYDPINPTDEAGQTASKSTINYVAAPDGSTTCCPGLTFQQKNKYIDLHDFDIYSAAARSAVTHRGYATVGFCEKGRTRDFFCNLGAYIEAAQNNGALSFWGLWGKLGVTF